MCMNLEEPVSSQFFALAWVGPAAGVMGWWGEGGVLLQKHKKLSRCTQTARAKAALYLKPTSKRGFEGPRET
jgi:hypothetical protein